MFGSDCMLEFAGMEWSCLCPMSRRHRNETMHLYGMNDMSVVRPSLLRMAGAVFLYPPFIVQVRRSTHASFHSKAARPSLLIGSSQDELSCMLAEQHILSAAFLLQDLSCSNGNLVLFVYRCVLFRCSSLTVTTHSPYCSCQLHTCCKHEVP